MSCLPIVKHFGRIMSKMASVLKQSKKYDLLSESKHKSYKLPFIDSEIENCTGSLFNSSSGYSSPPSESPSLKKPFKAVEAHGLKNCYSDTKLQSSFDSLSIDENSSASAKLSWAESVNLFFDTQSKQFEIFENFVQSSYGFSNCSMFSYSPLSSLDSISHNQNNNDLYCNDLSYRMQQECIRKEFEMNGNDLPPNDINDENFQPLAMSTPFVERKSGSFKFNVSATSKRDEDYMQSAQQMLPEIHQLSESSSTFQSYPISFVDEAPTPNFFPPLSSATYENNSNKNHGRKRNHQGFLNHLPLALPNHLQTVNNPNNQFGNVRNKKMAKKLAKSKKKMDDFCVFCKNNGADEILYKSHTVKDAKGRVLCPKLRAYQCPICGEDGDNSHTVKYCPKKPIVTMDDLHQMEVSRHALKRF